MLRCNKFYPAFGGGSLTSEFTNIAFDLEVPEIPSEVCSDYGESE